MLSTAARSRWATIDARQAYKEAAIPANICIVVVSVAGVMLALKDAAPIARTMVSIGSALWIIGRDSVRISACDPLADITLS